MLPEFILFIETQQVFYYNDCDNLILEGLKWLAIIPSIVLAHIHHVHAMANAVNVLHTTAEAEKCRDASFPNPEKKLTTGQLKIFIMIIKRMVKTAFLPSL